MFSCLLGKCVGVKLLGPLVSTIDFIKTCQTVLPSGYPSLHCHRQCRTVSPRSGQGSCVCPRTCLCFSFAFPWWLQLWSIFPYANVPFLHLFWWNVSSTLLPSFKLGHLSSHCWAIEHSFISSRCVFHICVFANILFQSVAYLPIFLTVSFEKQNHLIRSSPMCQFFLMVHILCTFWEIFA